MGLITGIMSTLFGGGRNIITETAEVFRQNAENAGVRDADVQTAVLQQFAAEFAQPRKGLFDRFIDGLNRLPRPFLALGTLGLFVTAMVDPIWFASRMQGVALVPEPLWWLMGAIVSFYFGARHQVKGQEFQASIAETMGRTGDVVRNIKSLEGLSAPEAPQVDAPQGPDAPAQNAALADWQRQNGS